MSDSKIIMDLLKEINNQLDKGLNRYFSNSGITATQLAVINILGKRDMVKLSELSETLKVTPAAVSLIANRLESRRVIEKVRRNDDQRVVYAKLTDEFKATHSNLDSDVNGFLALLLGTKTKDEIKLIIAGLEVLKNLLDSSETVLANHIKI